MPPPAPLPESISARRATFAALKAGLTGSTAAPKTAAETMLASAIPALDRLLGGGFPRGALVTLEGSAGCWSIAARLVAQVTRRALAAIVDDGGLYPPSLAQAGASLDRVLIAPAKTPLAAARAADILLRSRACRLVLMSAPNLRAAVWSRLAHLAHRTGVLLIAIAQRAAAPLAAAAAVRIDCALERLVLYGTRGLWGTLAGYELSARVHRHRRSAEACARIRAAVSLDGARLRERSVTSEVAAGFERLAHAAVR